EETRGVTVETVDDPRALRGAAGDAAQEALDERAGGPARPRMDRDPGGLVDDEQVLVLVGDRELDRLRTERLGCRGRLEDDLLPTTQPVALRPRPAVD